MKECGQGTWNFNRDRNRHVSRDAWYVYIIQVALRLNGVIGKRQAIIFAPFRVL